jgi:hypothetical protein
MHNMCLRLAEFIIRAIYSIFISLDIVHHKLRFGTQTITCALINGYRRILIILFTDKLSSAQ